MNSIMERRKQVRLQNGGEKKKMKKKRIRER